MVRFVNLARYLQAGVPVHSCACDCCDVSLRSFLKLSEFSQSVLIQTKIASSKFPDEGIPELYTVIVVRRPRLQNFREVQLQNARPQAVNNEVIVAEAMLPFSKASQSNGDFPTWEGFRV